MRNLRTSQNFLKRCYSQATGPAKTTGTTTTAPPTSNVKGLSNNCVRPATEPVGPGASSTGQYKVPEYFCFNRFSYAEAEIEMAKYRCPQPSAVKK